MTINDIYNQIYSLAGLDGVDFFTVGYSLLSQPIYGVHIGNYDGNQILVEGAIHAREYITSSLIVELVKYYYKMPIDGGMYFIPMVNPDGVRLVLDGLEGIKCEKLREFLTSVNDGKNDFSQWKADANAVDLNVNFDALWGGGSQNVFCPAPGNFVGYYPNSEREVNTLINFTNKNQPNATISYHTKGEVIYYGFEMLNAEQLARDLKIAQTLSGVTGYQIVKTENSTGGYSDWVSEYLGVPAYTIEVGNASLPHPIGENQLPLIFEQNKDVPMTLLNQINELNKPTTLPKTQERKLTLAQKLVNRLSRRR